MTEAIEGAHKMHQEGLKITMTEPVKKKQSEEERLAAEEAAAAAAEEEAAKAEAMAELLTSVKDDADKLVTTAGKIGEELRGMSAAAAQLPSLFLKLGGRQSIIDTAHQAKVEEEERALQSREKVRKEHEKNVKMEKKLQKNNSSLSVDESRNSALGGGNGAKRGSMMREAEAKELEEGTTDADAMVAAAVG